MAIATLWAGADLIGGYFLRRMSRHARAWLEGSAWATVAVLPLVSAVLWLNLPNALRVVVDQHALAASIIASCGLCLLLARPLMVLRHLRSLELRSLLTAPQMF